MSRYGIPYVGSKNSIAKWIIDSLPTADVFVDLCFGGGAVTHAALLSGKYEKFVANDKDGRLIPFFIDCCKGEYTPEKHKEWISREDFFRLKDDVFIELMWSFGNNGCQYFCSEEREPLKKALHYACYFNDTSLLNKLGFDPPVSEEKTIYGRYKKYKQYLGERLQTLEHLESLTRIYNLKYLQNIHNLDRLEGLSCDYVEAAEITKRRYAGKDILFYVDPPYASTDCRSYKGFDSNRFYEWADKQDNIFISEYYMPDNFIPYAWKEKQVLTSCYTNSIRKKEMIFTNKKTWERLTEKEKEISIQNFAKQTTIEDFINDNGFSKSG